jgi:hypothetical protein
VDVTNHNDPAGDPTVISYRIQIPTQSAPIDFALHDGEYKGFGFEGLVVVQALVPSGWEVADIQCTGPNPAGFNIDVPNGRVTLQHGVSDEQFCSFTNRRKSASGGSSSGVTPRRRTPRPVRRWYCRAGPRSWAQGRTRVRRRDGPHHAALGDQDAAVAREPRARDVARRPQGRGL